MPVKLNSTGGGSVTLDVGSTASNFNLTLPSTTGTVALVSGDLGTPTSLVGTNITGTATGLNAGVGVGQTWQNVSGSRTAGTTYTNSTGKPIVVSVSISRSGDVARVTMIVNGISVASAWTGVSGIEQRACAPVIVPNGSTYSIADVSGSIAIWAELR